MNRSYRILPVYAGDVSGACSALYELGGMVVIHDPSGCNSTYNTHDETRWYDQDSLIFLSGLTERDAVLGDDNKLLEDTVRAALSLRPRFIALVSSPLPFINGTDFPALAALLRKRTGLPCFFVPTNGMHDYIRGGGQALALYAEHFVTGAAPRRPGTINILGATPLDLGLRGDPNSLRRFAAEAGFDVLSCWAMGDPPEALARAGEAAVNLVVSALGLPAARTLQRCFGTPYVTGMPVDGFRGLLADALLTAARTGENAHPCREARSPAPDSSALAVGEPILMGSLAAGIEALTGTPLRVLCPLEADSSLLGPGDRFVIGEEEVETALSGARAVLADPLYKPVCPPGARLLPLPHQAFSGRNSWRAPADGPARAVELLAKY